MLSAPCCCVQAAEYTAIREELYFLRPLKAKLAGLLFWMTNLLWFQVRPSTCMSCRICYRQQQPGMMLST